MIHDPFLPKYLTKFAVLYIKMQMVENKRAMLTIIPCAISRVTHFHQNAQKLNNKCNTYCMSCRCKLIIGHQNNEVIQLQRCKLAVGSQILTREDKGKGTYDKTYIAAVCWRVYILRKKAITQKNRRHSRDCILYDCFLRKTLLFFFKFPSALCELKLYLNFPS